MSVVDLMQTWLNNAAEADDRQLYRIDLQCGCTVRLFLRKGDRP